MKKRIDLLLVERGLAPTRERAQSIILAGKVLVDDLPVTKPGHSVSEDAIIRVKGEDHPYVSRGGLKLAAALDAFGVSAEGRVGLDIGASTGGFTHVLLLRGASQVFAIDVGHNQLDWSIRKDPRVVVHEKVNARHMELGLIGRQVDLIVVDVSFISLDKIFPAALPFAHSETDWITLIKPQFEVGKEKVGKGGIVTSEEDRQEAVERLVRFGETLGLRHLGLIESPITGTQGNKEFLAHWKLQQRLDPEPGSSSPSHSSH
jgi:23S rRNA (cytidine1920-2'-O)/16S rRNA (cytidine1409-2'-O)-methyltransferase